jgi:hypothetical protein
MPNLWRTPDAQISQRSASFSIASEALKLAIKSGTALDIAGPDLETGRRLTISYGVNTENKKEEECEESKKHHPGHSGCAASRWDDHKDYRH